MTTQLVLDTKTGVGWYTREGWAAVKGSALDPERFETSYEEWIAMAEQALADMRRNGIWPIQVKVDPERLRKWCERLGRQNDAAARSQFVVDEMRSHGLPL